MLWRETLKKSKVTLAYCISWWHISEATLFHKLTLSQKLCLALPILGLQSTTAHPLKRAPVLLIITPVHVAKPGYCLHCWDLSSYWANEKEKGEERIKEIYRFIYNFSPQLLMHAKLLQAYATLRDPMDCSPPDSSVHGILQARILEWVPMPSSRRSAWPRGRSHVFCISWIGRRVLYH